ncbi:MAG: hypothetical protein WDM78_01320 [Puia sp.]
MLVQVTIKNRMSKDEYLHVIENLRNHILLGDCYEINYCQEFLRNRVNLDPLELYRALSSISPSPLLSFLFGG